MGYKLYNCTNCDDSVSSVLPTTDGQSLCADCHKEYMKRLEDEEA